eukprot:gene8652-11695_t
MGNNSDYGVDVTFPIHHRLNKYSNPYYYKRYTDLMEGCYRRYSWSDCYGTEDERIAMNLAQPSTQHNYTKLGFKKLKLPQHIWEPLISFFEKYKNTEELEHWPRGNTYVNHWDSPSFMIPFEKNSEGYAVKIKIWEEVKPIIEEWTNKSLLQTSLYGIRVYKNNAVLATHVDRLPLVSSCIINVAQDVNEPWPIEVYSHEGKAYNITMEPGDMVLYESHTVLHGRPFPMNGSYYANVFVHFEPIDHDEVNLHDPALHKPIPPSLSIVDYIKEYLSLSRKALQQILNNHYSFHLTRDDFPSQSIGGHEQTNHIIKNKPPQQRGKNIHNIEQKSNLKSKDQELLDLIIQGDISSLEKFFKDKNAVEILHHRDKNGWQPIHEAIRLGNEEVVKLLVDMGADIGSGVSGKGSLLTLARYQFENEDHPVIKYLIDIGTPEGEYNVEL